LVESSDQFRLLNEERVVIRSDWQKDRVAIVSGGGSGHEPFAAGLVGSGGITGAVCGSVFASPPAGSVLAALREVTGPAGCLLVVFNYTGDRVNFGLAANRAKAEGLKVSVRFIQDDCALESEDKAVGRRGLLGGIATLKVLSAAAEQGKTLTEMEQIFDQVTESSNLGTIGFSTSGCSLPVGKPGILLETGEVELGLGVHGEPGIRKWKFTNNTELIGQLLPLVNRRLKLSGSDEVMLLLNNLGGMTEIEVLNLQKVILDQIAQLGAKVIRIASGHMMTSLDMAGLNFTILKLNSQTKSLIDAPTDMLGWPRVTVPKGKIQASSEIQSKTTINQADSLVQDLTGVRSMIKKVCEKLISAEVELNDLDAVTGDGDCGSTTKLGANGVLKMLDTTQTTNFASLVYEIGSVLEKEMGGSSGCLLSIMFTAMAAEMRNSKETNLSTMSKALKAGIEEMMHVGRAQQGDRTMLDALIPAQQALENGIELAATAAEKGAQSTATMIAKAGRAAYCKERNTEQHPDSGAIMISKAFSAML